jgi:hypothetical protein
MARKVTYGVASSLDGYIARQDHAVEWLQWSNEVAAMSARYKCPCGLPDPSGSGTAASCSPSR